MIPLVLSFGTNNRSGARPSTTDPPSTADPPVLQMLQLISALPLLGVLCLMFILLFVLCDKYTILHCSSPVPQDSRHSNSVAVLQNHIAEILFPSSIPCAQLKLGSAPLLFKSGQRSIWPLTKQASLHVMETFTIPTSRELDKTLFPLLQLWLKSAEMALGDAVPYHIVHCKD